MLATPGRGRQGKALSQDCGGMPVNAGRRKSPPASCARASNDGVHPPQLPHQEEMSTHEIRTYVLRSTGVGTSRIEAALKDL